MVSTKPRSSTEIREGITYLHGQRTFLNSTDYPYYRDDPKNWPDRLEKLKSLGHTVVACYIPWRHHEVEIDQVRQFDFRGETLPNRDVIGFLRLCHEKGLKVIAKPGPFVHAELNYGGLPNWVCPSINSAIEPMIGAKGSPFPWGGIKAKADGSSLEELPLPAPFDPTFLSEVEHWLRSVTETVIGPLREPDGPICMVQVANEGIFSNYQRAPWAYDYSRSSLQLYAQFLRKTYSTLEHYNQLHRTSRTRWEEIDPPRTWNCPPDLPGILFYADWSAYQSYYMREIYTRLLNCLQVDVPFVINANPPTDDPFGIDSWMSRINPDDLPGIAYGFTNWIGVACKDPSVVERYQVMIKRARGANQEENWGFSKLYEPDFEYPFVCFYQTLIEVASGATGYNVYTGVKTRHADPDLDLIHRLGYPDNPPIDDDGNFTPKADIVFHLNRFFNRLGSDFLETRPVRKIAFGLYLPYAQSAVWVAPQDWEKMAAMGLPNHGQMLLQFQRLCLKNHLDFDLLNLQHVEDIQLQKTPTLVLASGRWMDRRTQEKLRKYAQDGGRIILVGEIPKRDENFQPACLLGDAQTGIQVISSSDFMKLAAGDWIQRLPSKPEVLPLSAEAEGAWLWQYRHPEAEIDYLFVFNKKEIIHPIEFRFNTHRQTHTLSLTLPAYTASIIRIQDGSITDILAKGKNEEQNVEVVVTCSLNGKAISAKEPGDWVYSIGTDQKNL